MLTVLIKTESHYTVDRKRIRNRISKFLEERGVKGDVEISVSIVGDRMMRKLNKTYRNLDTTTNVLSFPLAVNHTKENFVDPPDHKLYLGDIIISYPQAREDAADEEKLVDQVIDELVVHGLNHLLGNHHE